MSTLPRMDEYFMISIRGFYRSRLLMNKSPNPVTSGTPSCCLLPRQALPVG